MRFSDRDGTCGEDEYCVQLFSRRAALLNEFCLDKKENNIPNIKAAEDFLRRTLAPCEFAGTTVSVTGGEGTHDETILQFDPKQA